MARTATSTKSQAVLSSKPVVGIVMGSDSDLPVMKEAWEALTALR